MRLRLAFVVLLCGCNFGIRGVDLPSPGASGGAGGGGVVGGTTLDDMTVVAPPDLALVAPDMTAPPSQIGDACSGQCGAGLSCMTWVPNGYCSRTCDDASPCPTGSTCADIGGGAHYCLVDAQDGACARSDVGCRDCGANVCAPKNFCGGGC